jgi:hypothetical protein
MSDKQLDDTSLTELINKNIEKFKAKSKCAANERLLLLQRKIPKKR